MHLSTMLLALQWILLYFSSGDPLNFVKVSLAKVVGVIHQMKVKEVDVEVLFPNLVTSFILMGRCRPPIGNLLKPTTLKSLLSATPTVYMCSSCHHLH